MKTELRQELEQNIDLLELSQFTKGFDAALDAVEELSNFKHNKDEHLAASHLLWAVKELRGENA